MITNSALPPLQLRARKSKCFPAKNGFHSPASVRLAKARAWSCWMRQAGQSRPRRKGMTTSMSSEHSDNGHDKRIGGQTNGQAMSGPEIEPALKSEGPELLAQPEPS